MAALTELYRVWVHPKRGNSDVFTLDLQATSGQHARTNARRRKACRGKHVTGGYPVSMIEAEERMNQERRDYMTVAELRAKLDGLPDEATVTFDGEWAELDADSGRGREYICIYVSRADGPPHTLAQIELWAATT